jgi:hypothetical protein
LASEEDGRAFDVMGGARANALRAPPLFKPACTRRLRLTLCSQSRIRHACRSHATVASSPIPTCCSNLSPLGWETICGAAAQNGAPAASPSRRELLAYTFFRFLKGPLEVARGGVTLDPLLVGKRVSCRRKQRGSPNAYQRSQSHYAADHRQQFVTCRQKANSSDHRPLWAHKPIE